MRIRKTILAMLALALISMSHVLKAGKRSAIGNIYTKTFGYCKLHITCMATLTLGGSCSITAPLYYDGLLNCTENIPYSGSMKTVN